MALIDEWMPDYDAVERHRIRVRAPAARLWPLVQALEMRRSPVISALIALRTLPARLAGRVPPRPRATSRESLLRAGFVLLGEAEGSEIVLGLTGRFWRPSGDVLRVPAEDFRAFAEPGYAQAVWNFTVTEDGDAALVATETRIRCTDAASRRSFLRYWRLIHPFSGLIRTEMLRSIRRAAQAP